LYVETTLLNHNNYTTNNNNNNKRGRLYMYVKNYKREKEIFFCMLYWLVWKATACCNHDDDHQQEKWKEKSMCACARLYIYPKMIEEKKKENCGLFNLTIKEPSNSN